MENNTANMIGTEKQVAWAMQIKASWIAQLDGMVTEATARVNGGTMPTMWLESVTKITDKAKGTLNTWNAKQIIDQRNYPMLANAEKFARAEYAAVRS
jgi:hypothetical protein